MKERPIIFSAPMVRAILNGRKTQTRRIVKPQPELYEFLPALTEKSVSDPVVSVGAKDAHHWFKDTNCQYGKKGDRLWVRESWSTHSCLDSRKPSELIDCNSYHYWADGIISTGKRRPSIYMPRWVSRIDLEITSVRVERLQDISEADAIAEGVDGEKEAAERGSTWYDKPKRAYRFLWEEINGQGSWNLNPWVWVVSFNRI